MEQDRAEAVKRAWEEQLRAAVEQDEKVKQLLEARRMEGQSHFLREKEEELRVLPHMGCNVVSCLLPLTNVYFTQIVLLHLENHSRPESRGE